MSLSKKIFNHNILKKNRDRSFKKFHKSNFIHKAISDLMLDIILDQKTHFSNILEIGSLDSYLAKNIQKKISDSNIFISDISQKWMECNDSFSKIIMNDEFVSFQENSFDLICSNLNAHFYNDFLGFLIQSQYCLKKGGFFITSFLGQGSFKIIKDIFNEIEIEKYQRFSPRFIPTTDIKTSGALLQKAGFSNVISLIEEINIEYQDLQKILLDIKNVAGSNIMFDRDKRFITRNFLTEILKKLEEKKIENKINVNLNIIIMFGWNKKK